MDVELAIPFEFPVNDELVDAQWPKYAKRAEFWDSSTTFEWFKTRGYTLYMRYGIDIEDDPYPDTFVPRMLDDNDDLIKGHYPYAHHDGKSRLTPKGNRRGRHTRGKLAYAQDSDGRHVVIKLVLNSSDELQIFQMIKQESLETLEQNSIIPVLDILANGRFSFVVMPRWGNRIMAPPPFSLGEMIDIMRSLLKGLNFLHSKNILYRDISHNNLLVNHFTDILSEGSSIREGLRKTGELRYAIFDFDISMIVPQGIDRATFRLPYWMSWWGSMPRPYDVSQGQPDYNPFAFDVGCLGILFCEWSQHHTGDVPFLAPFLDRMTTRNPSRRFTAQEALQFLDERVSELTGDVLSKQYRELPAREEKDYESWDRWKEVPTSFAQEWAAYREPPVPPVVRFLRWVCSFERLGRFIPYICWLIRKVLP